MKLHILLIGSVHKTLLLIPGFLFSFLFFFLPLSFQDIVAAMDHCVCYNSGLFCEFMDSHFLVNNNEIQMGTFLTEVTLRMCVRRNSSETNAYKLQTEHFNYESSI